MATGNWRSYDQNRYANVCDPHYQHIFFSTIETAMPGYLFIILLSFLVFLTPCRLPAETDVLPNIELAISFVPEKQYLSGTAKITVPAGQELQIDISSLEVTGCILNNEQGENREIDTTGMDTIQLPGSPTRQVLLLSYSKTVQKSYYNNLSPRAIILTSNWHPRPDSKARFSLSATIPAGFIALSESDTFEPTTRQNTARFHFSQPVYNLTFVAAPFIHTAMKVREGLSVHTLFFPEDQHLSNTYLTAAVRHINHYERVLGPFPYHHYVIAENLMPTGFGFPSFTLLGKQVVNLPFIKDISLRHEILHSWFGNAIDVDYHTGNWCEGLTTYLADMAYRTEKNEGAAARRETIQDYLSYVTPTTPPLAHFLSAGHHMVSGRDRRSVGYGRCALLFHELEERIGTTAFTSALRTFSQNFNGKTAAWRDLQETFENETGLDLELFFKQRLTRIAPARIDIEALSVKNSGEGQELSFTIVQNSPEPYQLLLPFTIKTITGDQHFTELIDQRKTIITRRLASQPTELVIDPDYHLLRQPAPEERYPSWSRFLGKKDVVVILPEDTKQHKTYQAFIEMAERLSWKFISADKTEQAVTEGKSLIFLGTNPYYRGLYGQTDHPQTGFTLEVREHPFKPETLVAAISSSSAAESAASVHRLKHYGAFSYLSFKNGHINVKRKAAAQNGIHLPIELKPKGVAIDHLHDFDRMVTQLAENRVVYIGEKHTARSDHLLQLMLIQALHRKNRNLAIAMEMFPTTSQQALDDYVLYAKTGEAEFLKASRYDAVWRFDYRLLRPILTYARKQQIPVIGLNLERSIVSSVYQNGGIAKLPAETRDLLPTDRKLDMEGYVERLTTVHDYHTRMSGADGSLSSFIEAQSLWDESMAEEIARFLKRNKTTQLIVLAGSQHTRKDSGIPPRVARRTPVSQRSVINLATSTVNGAELKKTADIGFYLKSSELEPQGKIGVILEPSTEPSVHGMSIESITPYSHAAAAGIKKHDVITMINNTSVTTMADIRYALLDKIAGETVTMVIQRKEDGNNWQEQTYEVSLSGPQKPTGHP